VTPDEPTDAELAELAELAVLVALDAVSEDDRDDAERRAGRVPRGVLDAVTALADAVAVVPPAGMRTRVLDAARERRPVGAAVGAPTPSSPVDAYRHAADDLYRLLGELSDRDWLRPAHSDHGPVRDLVAHLFGIEQLTLDWACDRPAPDPAAVADHVQATRATVTALAGLDPGAVAARWHSLTREVEAAVRGADPAQPVVAHHIPADIDTLTVLRVFEIWAHTFDICTATGRPRPVPDPPRLALMSARLMRALPMALAVRGTLAPARTARFVLTGDAPGCHDVALDPRGVPAAPDVVIVTDALDVCQLASRRLTPDQLDAFVEGDTALADVVLSAAATFALD
jgi:uncharacterized protein (TIGR03083 family)